MRCWTYWPKANWCARSGCAQASGASREVLRTLLQKKWIVREDLSGARDARRLVKIAVLREALSEAQDEPKAQKLNAAQQRVVNLLRQAQGRMRMDDLREAGISAEFAEDAGEARDS